MLEQSTRSGGDMTSMSEAFVQPNPGKRRMPSNIRSMADGDALAVLHVENQINETTPVYNEHCLPLVGHRHLAICSFFEAKIPTVEEIAVFDGDGTLAGLYRAFKAALSHRDYDIIHVHSPHMAFLLSVGRMIGLGKSGASTVCTVHDSYEAFETRHKLLLIPAFALFDRVVSCSKASFTSFPKFYRWLAGERFCFVQNGLDISRADRALERLQTTRERSTFTVISACRFVTKKNLRATITAFQRSGNPAGQLTLVGDGPLREQLANQIESEGLQEHVEFTGLVPRDEVYKYFQSSDLFVSTSYGEGLPIAVLEAMACSCPVLLSDIPPHREIAEGTDFIPLIASDDVAGFAREIARFRDMPASQRTAIGNQCRKLVEERFSLKKMHAGYEQVYQELRQAKRSKQQGSARSESSR